MDARKIGFWVSTGLGTAILAFGGINEVTHAQRIVDTMAHLGYPAWLPSLLGTWKLLAVVAILAPRLPRLKEWAYAGVFFDVTGAITSHAVVGDAATHLAPPIVVLALLATSWALRPTERKLVAASRVEPTFAARRLASVTGESIPVPEPGKLVRSVSRNRSSRCSIRARGRQSRVA